MTPTSLPNACVLLNNRRREHFFLFPPMQFNIYRIDDIPSFCRMLLIWRAKSIFLRRLVFGFFWYTGRSRFGNLENLAFLGVNCRRHRLIGHIRNQIRRGVLTVSMDIVSLVSKWSFRLRRFHKINTFDIKSRLFYTNCKGVTSGHFGDSSLPAEIR